MDKNHCPVDRLALSLSRQSDRLITDDEIDLGLVHPLEGV